MTSGFLRIKVRVQQSLTSFVRGFSLHWRSYGGWGLASSWLQPLPFLLPFILRLSSLALSIKGTFFAWDIMKFISFLHRIFLQLMLLYCTVKEFYFTDIPILIEMNPFSVLNMYEAISWLSLLSRWKQEIKYISCGFPSTKVLFRLAIAAFASDNFEELSIVRRNYVDFTEKNGVSNNPVG